MQKHIPLQLGNEKEYSIDGQIKLCLGHEYGA